MQVITEHGLNSPGFISGVNFSDGPILHESYTLTGLEQQNRGGVKEAQRVMVAQAGMERLLIKSFNPVTKSPAKGNNLSYNAKPSAAKPEVDSRGA
jgi:hypothetical protein